MIYLTSDFHFFHNREFVYEARGFDSVEEMNNRIVQNFNHIVKYDDDVYILGDLLLGGFDKQYEGLELIGALNGKLHLIRGNHDTNQRWAAYESLHNVVEMQNAIYLNYKKYHFYLSHFPTITGNIEKEALRQMTLNLYGHTHQWESNFFEDKPYMYHVGVDSHNCTPILLDDIIKEMKIKYQKEKEQEKEIIIPRCNKCVYEYDCCNDDDLDGKCKTYKRDPPDGGYYG